MNITYLFTYLINYKDKLADFVHFFRRHDFRIGHGIRVVNSLQT